ncbi:hypothetical protein Ddye_010408 [Dipteronia dyeriana]|uniref:Cytochrome P450 n=1 Tax=Dipteronia dyeriana TaxID=168575 RepID=A0AAE0CN93_9ROSI|nr:hypothetical protein Ddye_010408 [Dipteronia dyeriana]
MNVCQLPCHQALHKFCPELLVKLMMSNVHFYLRTIFVDSEMRFKVLTEFLSAPQAGGAWPIIGHMHLFGDQQLTHKTLGDMADKYGPVFTIRLGSHRVLVLNSWEAARECFTVHDKVFCTRPSTTGSKLLGYDYAMSGYSPYGSCWPEMRKISTIELLSNHQINMLESIRTS